MDDLSFRLGNRAVGNPRGRRRPRVHRRRAERCGSRTATVVVRAPVPAPTAAPSTATPVAPLWEPVAVPAGGDARARRRRRAAACARYLAVRGGLDVPALPGQRVDVHARRVRRPRRPGAARRRRAARRPRPNGDRHARQAAPRPAAGRAVDRTVGDRRARRPARAHPSSSPGDDIDDCSTPTDWEVHYNSARTGVRLIGPEPRWARADGGEAGLHPSNIHDTALRGRRASTSPATCRSSSAPTAEPRRLRVPGGGRRRPSAGSSASCARATPCASSPCRGEADARPLGAPMRDARARADAAPAATATTAVLARRPAGDGDPPSVTYRARRRRQPARRVRRR